MLIEREFTIDAPLSVVWNFIKDKEKFAKCVPNLEQMKIVNDQRFILILKPKLTFLRGRIEMDCTIKKMEDNTGILLVKGKSIGSSFDAISEIILADKKNKTTLHWNVEITLQGLLKHVPESVIRATVYFIADRMIKNLSGLT
ncbi:MAG: hypothetical protein K940chlam7_00126 [Chlamydiae bacterium]|nr:hypothetical protein [Chlamydiota bacterium]